MSQMHYTPYAVQPEPSNGLAVAGLVVVLVGIFTGGILTPIGLIMSLVALGRPGGKGLAWAGVIIGFIFTCLGAILWIAFGAVILAALGIGALAVVLSQHEKVEVTAEMGLIAAQVEQYRDENNGILPANLSALSIPQSRLIDPWGKEYRYLLDDQVDRGFVLVSDGEDRKPNTEDDVSLDNLDELWSSGGGVEIIASGRDERGTVRVKIGGETITISGGEEGGKITLNKEGETFEIDSTGDRSTSDEDGTGDHEGSSSEDRGGSGGS